MITPPPLIEAAPGAPITAEGWNNLRQAVLTLYDAVNKSPGTLSVRVKNKADGSIVVDAQDTLVAGGEPPRPSRAAAFLGGTLQRHQVEGLLAGSYDMVVEAAGFGSDTRTVIMDEAGGPQTLSVELTPSAVTVVVPNLFGIAVNVAMVQAVTAGLQVLRVIDSYGTDLAPAGIPEEAKNSPVLNQVPEPGVVVPQNSALQLHISAKVAQQVKVPDLSGLTLNEAKQQLAALGLALGETRNLGS